MPVDADTRATSVDPANSKPSVGNVTVNDHMRPAITGACTTGGIFNSNVPATIPLVPNASAFAACRSASEGPNLDERFDLYFSANLNRTDNTTTLLPGSHPALIMGNVADSAAPLDRIDRRMNVEKSVKREYRSQKADGFYGLLLCCSPEPKRKHFNPFSIFLDFSYFQKFIVVYLSKC